jgi:hypothetical protein
MASEPKWVLARNQSRAFMLAAQRCNEHRPLPSGHFQFLLVPSLVNYAFSIEVGLKALAMKESGNAGRGHDLKKLVDALSPPLRTQIVRDTESRYPGSRFDSDIEAVRDVFEVWRYIYESGMTDTDLGFLQRFAAAVQRSLDPLPRAPRGRDEPHRAHPQRAPSTGAPFAYEAPAATHAR